MPKKIKKNLKKNNQYIDNNRDLMDNTINIDVNEKLDTFITEVLEDELVKNIESIENKCIQENKLESEMNLIKKEESDVKYQINVDLNEYFELKKDLSSANKKIIELTEIIELNKNTESKYQILLIELEEIKRKLITNEKELEESNSKLNFYLEQTENLQIENCNLKNELEDTKSRIELNSEKLLTLIKTQVEKQNLIDNDENSVMKSKIEVLTTDEQSLTLEQNLNTDLNTDLNKKLEQENTESNDFVYKQELLIKQRRKARRF